MVSGTPGYTAPEVLLRNEVGPAADVFALGATLAYTATGRAPYGTGEPAAVSYRTVHEDIDLAGVRPALAELIRQCVAKDPADRPEPGAVIARCAVDSPLASDAHYRMLVRTTGAVPESGYAKTPPMASGPHLEPEPETGTVRAPESEDRTRPTPRDQAVDRAEQVEDAAPTGPPDTAPDDQRDPRHRPGRSSRGRGWLAVCAVALAVPLTVWLLPESGPSDRKDTGGAPTTETITSGRPDAPQPDASRPATKGPAARPPDHIVNDRVSQDRWTLSDEPEQAAQGMGSCDLSSLVDSSPPTGLQSSVSHTTGSDTASLQLRPKDAGEGKRPAPYYISVGVRPPHETDRATGRPLRSVSKGIGFTSKPVDIYSRWSTGGTLTFKYPEDFRAHFGERTVDALPVGDDRGDWTVVLYHVEGGPTKYTSIVCNGFHA